MICLADDFFDSNAEASPLDRSPLGVDEHICDHVLQDYEMYAPDGGSRTVTYASKADPSSESAGKQPKL